MGLSAEWDGAILAAHRAGNVTAVSLVPNGPTYASAVAALKASPALDPGVHLNLLSGSPLSPASEVSSLVDASGEFRPGLPGFLARHAAGAIRHVEVAIEWERQVRRVFESGLRPVHLNSHFHVHMLPGLWAVARELAARFGIRYLRMAGDPPWTVPVRNPSEALRSAKTTVLWVLSRLAREGEGTVEVVSCRGLFLTEAPLEDWRKFVAGLRPGVTELVCHPGQTPVETRILLSRELRDILMKGAFLGGFRDQGKR